MNDFINAQINAVTVTFIMIKKSLIENLSISSLMLKYFENFMQIIYYLNTLQKLMLMTFSIF